MKKNQNTLLILTLLSLVVFTSCGGETPLDPEKDDQNIVHNEKQHNKSTIDDVTGLDTTVQLFSIASLENESEILVPFRKGDKWGFSDLSQNIVIAPIYDYVKPFSNGMAKVGIKKDSTKLNYGVINKKGEEIIPVNYKYVAGQGCNLIALEVDEGVVIVDHTSKRISNDFYDFVTREFCSEDRVFVTKNEQRAIINEKGQYITDYIYSASWFFKGGLCPVKKGDDSSAKWGLIDKFGNTVVDFLYQEIFPSKNGLFVATKYVSNNVGREGKKWGVINGKGEVVIPFEYDNINGTFSGELCIAEKENGKTTKSYLFDRSGKLLYSNGLEYYEEFKEGVAVFKKKEKFGFVDSKGNIVIKPVYDWACGFSNGLAWVNKNGKYGFIDKKNNVVIPIEYQSLYDYVYMEEFGAPVSKESVDGHFYIDKNGKEYYE